MEPEAQIARPFLHQEAEKTSEGADETLRTPVAIFQIRSWALRPCRLSSYQDRRALCATCVSDSGGRTFTQNRRVEAINTAEHVRRRAQIAVGVDGNLHTRQVLRFDGNTFEVAVGCQDTRHHLLSL